VTALATLVVAAMVLVGFGRLGEAVVDQARAQSVADSVALAAIEYGTDRAEQIAAANHASIAMIRDLGDDVLVDVIVGDRSAEARASTAP